MQSSYSCASEKRNILFLWLYNLTHFSLVQTSIDGPDRANFAFRCSNLFLPKLNSIITTELLTVPEGRCPSAGHPWDPLLASLILIVSSREFWQAKEKKKKIRSVSFITNSKINRRQRRGALPVVCCSEFRSGTRWHFYICGSPRRVHCILIVDWGFPQTQLTLKRSSANVIA